MKKRNYGIDFLKFIAAVMITNSHYAPLYEDHNVSFATFGVQGNALFFFVSGLFLTNIQKKDGNYVRFDFWVRKKFIRLWPSLIVVAVFSNLLFSKEIGWYDFILAGDFWFVRCFIVSFSIIYFLIKYLDKYLIQMLFFSIFLTSLYIYLSPKTGKSIFHEFHYIIYFSSMLLGSYIGRSRKNITGTNLLIDLIFCVISFILYFIVMYFGKGKVDNWYYIQLLAVFPLLSFLYYSYKIVNYQWCNTLANYKIWFFVSIISALTYEIYLVQFIVITDVFNYWYPFNTIIVFTLILSAAYVLRIATNFFLQLFSNKNWSVEQTFYL
ncbi:acyltransferase [Maribacter sp. M208]|uniref:acyltransferase family protein n=1 Tax=Maribacter huludaoensis TaxID=3030010 RepID=UPI0023EB9E68|nr:acyltransferase [Maribacter huludaoensis]MDF4221113.1 acyltransferase [Maribacter huludaoensis]